MGQTWASEQPAAQPSPASTADLDVGHLFTPFEKLSLKLNLAYIQDDSAKLLEVLGVRECVGTDVLLRMAQNLAHNHLKTRIPLVIGWFDGRVPERLGLDAAGWHLALFCAASSAEVGGEHYISFEDMYNLVWLSLSAFDLDPQTYTSAQLRMLEHDAVLRILQPIKVPAIELERLNTIFVKFPFVLRPLGNVWHRLLVDRQTIESRPAPARPPHSLTRARHAVLYAILGPKVLHLKQLYQATTDGFSMHTLEANTADWTGSSLLVLRGRRPDSRESQTLVLFVDSPWRPNLKRSFGEDECLLVQLEPEIETWPVPTKSIFMSSAVGIGAGLDHPPRNGEITRGTLLFVPIRLKEAVFKHVSHGRQIEQHITVDQLEVLGCEVAGDEATAQ